MSNTDNQAQINVLQRQHNSEQNQVNGLGNSIRELRSRRTHLNTARSNLSRDANNRAGRVNAQIDNIENHLSAGLRNSSLNSRIGAIFQGGRESGLGNDPNLTSSDIETQNEINFIDSEIARLEAEQQRRRAEMGAIARAIDTLRG